MRVGRTQVPARPPAFAQILRDQGKLPQEILDEALRRQAQEQQYIGEILCEIAPLTASDVARALELQQYLGLL